MKTAPLVALLVLSLAPCAFSQQLIADSITNSSASSGLLCLGPNSSAAPLGVALGYGAQAGDYGMAVGSDSFAGAAGIALGEGNRASDYSTAIGHYSSSPSSYSVAAGYWTFSADDYSVVLGSKNLSASRSYETLTAGWVEDSILFELGNGEPYPEAEWYRFNPSNAITTLKNGQTTLTNKAWLNRDSGMSATADPSSATTDSGGEALVVEGHTRLKGKVIIEEAQGDISMGIYQ